MAKIKAEDFDDFMRAKIRDWVAWAKRNPAKAREQLERERLERVTAYLKTKGESK